MNMREQLTELVRKYDLINRTYEYFWINYDKYLAEEPEEAHSVGLFDRNSIEEPFLRNVEYMLTNGKSLDSFDRELLSVRLDFCLKGSGCIIWNYTCDFTLNGEVFDDWFIID